MCDDVELSTMMSSIAHDHDYLNSQIKQNPSSIIDNNIETMLSIDESFGALLYEPDAYEVFEKKLADLDEIHMFVEKNFRTFPR